MPTFAALADQFLQEEFADAPVRASGLGVAGYDDQLDDLSEAAFAARDRRAAAWLDRFAAVPDDGLSFDERLDRDLVLSVLRGRLIMADWLMWRRQPATYLGPGLDGVFSLFLHRLRPEAELAHAAAARLRAVPEALAHGKRNLTPDLTPPLYLERGVGQARAAARYARDLVPLEVGDPALRAELAAAGATAAAAFEDFAAFLTDLQPRATGDWAIGEERYSRLLREKELLGYGAGALRERGRAQYDAVAETLRQGARAFAGTDDWPALLHDLSRDHPPTPAAMRAAYAEWTERARQFLKDRRLVSFPAGESCAVEPSPPFQRPVLAVASYQNPPPFSPSRHGHFFVPFPPDGVSDQEIAQRLETNCHGTIPTITVHEAYPGHHWHLVTMQDHPSALRQAYRTPFFTEGWGLYAERLMREQGFFDDPRYELFHHQATIFRAARIIVDTSLHMGEMTTDAATRFLVDQVKLSEPTARAEVGRYCSWPTQAASYLTGCLEIVRIRDRYFAEKGVSGVDGLRAFHDTIARSGGLPIALAEQAALA